MNECETPKSEIIENLKKDIKSKEDKLEHLLDEKQKTNNENRIIELTNIIRVTEQEIKFGKEDLENEKINVEVVLGNIPASSMCCGRGDGCSRSTARS